MGTHADPITYAGATAATPKGSIIYVPKYKKYFIMEDQCEECEKDWKNKQMYHMDLWTGPSHAVTAVVVCED